MVPTRQRLEARNRAVLQTNDWLVKDADFLALQGAAKLGLQRQTVGLARARSRGDGGDRFEDETLAFFARVGEGYAALAREAPERIRRIDATEGADAVLAAALQILKRELGTASR